MFPYCEDMEEMIRTLPENENLPADHPNYIVPIFLRNERIMDHAY